MTHQQLSLFNAHDDERCFLPSCRLAPANRLHLVLHTAAYWLTLAVRDAIPKVRDLAKAEFATLRLRLLKIAARVVETASRVRLVAAACPEANLLPRLAGRPQPHVFIANLGAIVDRPPALETPSLSGQGPVAIPPPGLGGAGAGRFVTSTRAKSVQDDPSRLCHPGAAKQSPGSHKRDDTDGARRCGDCGVGDEYLQSFRATRHGLPRH